MKINLKQWRSMSANERVAMLQTHINKMSKGWVK